MGRQASDRGVGGARSENRSSKALVNATACPSCGRTTEPGGTFCGGCGAQLSTARSPSCASCRAPLDRGAHFCDRCGAPVRSRVRVFALAAATCLVAAAVIAAILVVPDNDNPPATANAGTALVEPGVTETEIQAATGGTVRGTFATVEIPPGALDSDAIVRIAPSARTNKLPGLFPARRVLHRND